MLCVFLNVTPFHRTLAPPRLTRCSAWRPIFVELWLSSWEEWRPHAAKWLDGAGPPNLHHIGCLRISQYFIDYIPAERMSQMRFRVAWHQYHMLIRITQLRQYLTMPPRTAAEGMEPLGERETPWFSKVKARRVTPNPTGKNLWEQCLDKTQESKKRAAVPPQLM